jgi:hypothetical protein
MRGLKRGSKAVRLVGLWVWISPVAWLSVSCECCVLSSRVLCDGWSLVQRSPTECGVSECDREASTMKRSWPPGSVEPLKIKDTAWILILRQKTLWTEVNLIGPNTYSSLLTTASRLKIRTFVFLSVFQIFERKPWIEDLPFVRFLIEQDTETRTNVYNS